MGQGVHFQLRVNDCIRQQLLRLRPQWARWHEQTGGLRRQGLQQLRQGGVVVSEEADPTFPSANRQPLRCPPGVGVKLLLALQ